MKITHVISDSNIGGAGVLLSSLASSLKDRYDIRILLPKGSMLKSRLCGLGVRADEINMTPDKSFSKKDVLLFYRYFLENPTDILHTHASLSARLGGALAGIKTCISTRHCATPNENIKKLSNLKIKLYNFCTSLTVSTADYATGNLLLEGISKDRIITIKNGSPKREKLDTDAALKLKSALGIADDAKIIGSCARLEKVKGQDLILRAAPKILKSVPRVHFLFVGDGKQRLEYERLAMSLGVKKRVTFAGFVENPESYESLFYINVNASRGTETSCLASSECMSFGIPTVASDFGGNTEMITPMVNGLLFKKDNPFDLEEKLLKLLSDSELYQRLSHGARMVYEKQFSLERMVSEYNALYESLGSSLPHVSRVL